MRYRGFFLLLVSVVVGCIFAFFSFAFLQLEHLRDEQRAVERLAAQRSDAIRTMLDRGTRQLDLLVAYIEASADIHVSQVAPYLRSVWKAFPDSEANGTLPIAMGWVDISRAPSGSVAVDKDGHLRRIEHTSQLDRILDEVIIEYHAFPQLFLRRGRADRGVFADRSGPYISVLKPAFKVAPNGARVIRGTAFAVFDLRTLVEDTALSFERGPLLRASIVNASYREVLLDETTVDGAVSPEIVFMEQASYELGFTDFRLVLDFFQEKGWDYSAGTSRPQQLKNQTEFAATIGAGIAICFLLVAAFFDIQNRRLRRLTAKAEEGARAKAEFLASMSHEIRTPMNGVFGMTELLSKTELNDKQRRYTDTILFSAEILLAIVDDILDYSKLETGMMKLDPVPIDLIENTNNVMRLLSVKARLKAVEMNLRIAPGVPSTVTIDPVRFKQVLTNLVGNAVKFTDNGQVTVIVEPVADVTTAAEKVTLRFSVIDTGIGIAPENQDRIFERFTQSDGSTTRKFGGTGLGLAISKQIISLMDGEIGVHSEPDKGSTFWFQVTVPFDEGAALDHGKALEGRRLLVVDDVAIGLQVMAEILEASGAEVVQCAEPGQVLTLLRSAAHEGRRFDAALIDYQMPSMKGDDLAKTIREDATLSGMPLILVSAVNIGIVSMIEEGGLFDGAISKPFTPERLLLEVSARLRAGWQEPNNSPARSVALISKLAARCAPATGMPTPGKSGGPATAALSPGRPEMGDGAPFTQRRVLVAEDSLINQTYVRETLERLGCRADVAANGEEALRMATARAYDVIIMDCHMPIMDGYAAAREISRRIAKGEISYVPIVALTANVQPGNKERCLAAGMEDYLTKPAKESVVAETLTRWFAIRDRKAGVTQQGAPPASALEPAQDGGVPAAASEPPAAATSGVGASVLVVEDSEINQAYMAETLEQGGYAVSSALNGEEAIAKVKAAPVDLILMDCHMPVMNGYEATAALSGMMAAGTIPKIPIIALTADVVGDNRKRCMEAGMVDYLTKPIRQDKLFEVLERWLPGERPGAVPDAGPVAASAEPAPASQLQDVASVTGYAGEADNIEAFDFVDPTVLQNGIDLFQDDFWPLVDRYLADLTKYLDIIDAALAEKQLGDIHMPVHSIKSSSRQIGAMRLGEVAALVEGFVHPENDSVDESALVPAIDQLRSTISTTRDALKVARAG